MSSGSPLRTTCATPSTAVPAISRPGVPPRKSRNRPRPHRPNKQKGPRESGPLFFHMHGMARVTGLEPATSGVTGRRSNQLSYTRVLAVAGQLGERPYPVNTVDRVFSGVLFFVLADMGQRAVLEQEAGNVGRTGCREHRLEDD